MSYCISSCHKELKCDIFCKVIDNYGDAAFCWRLAKELAERHNCKIRLIINDFKILSQLQIKYSHEHNLQKNSNLNQLISIIFWKNRKYIHFEGANLVIEAFACKLDEDYISELASFAKTNHIVWINLEYLSAEKWIHSYHLAKSPHPTLPIQKNFFFPGFTKKSGGLLRDHYTHHRQPSSHQEREKYWQSHGISIQPNTIFISIFCYEKSPLKQLINCCTFQKNYRFILFLTKIPAVNKLIKIFPKKIKKQSTYKENFTNQVQFSLKINAIYKLSNSCLCAILPFLNQQNYDDLLWHCDFNFIRGEDSFVRAQWAGQPFCWHIYPQKEQIHQQKLDAFLNLMLKNCDPSLITSIRAFWYIWNFSSTIDIKSFSTSWLYLMDHLQILDAHTKSWRGTLINQPDLVTQLMEFYNNSIQNTKN